MQVDLKNLLSKCGTLTLRAVEAAAGMCLSESHYEVTPDHVMLKLLDPPEGDMASIVKRFNLDVGWLLASLTERVEGCRRGNTSRPKLSAGLVRLLEDAWMFVSVDLGQPQIRTGAFVYAFLNWAESEFDEPYETLRKKLSAGDLRSRFREITADSSENVAGRGTAAGAGVAGLPPEGEGALARYTIDATERARKGEMDPIFGREEEIRRMIDILMRRKKNNPILVGEPGVGKTALVEGLALKIANQEVPEFLRNTRILSIDLGLLQAGAGVKGEFESRLKAVISEIKASPEPIISFIDEAHTLIGAGGPSGGSDAANLLKPALARGELRTIAATTWSEYKKYFEKDAALARRFELVKVEEPSQEKACVMLRGLREKYEKAHRVAILDSAVVAAVELSSRYLTGRQLPDKAEGLLDTACARVKVAHSCEPAGLQDVAARIGDLRIEIAAVEKDSAHGGKSNQERLTELRGALARLEEERVRISSAWQAEKEVIDKIESCRAGMDPVKADGRPELVEALRELARIQGNNPLVPLEVNADVVAAVVSDWTGIPTGRMVRDEAKSILAFEDNLKTRIRGQDHAVRAVAKAIRMAKAGVRRPDAPIGVFLFVGPSGVGKTECARGIADMLFGGEKCIISLNMSEYMEKHTVSRLIGSPPGYVGYGEGGVLTEGVRQRPYSVVLLDEVEKAHADVLNIFYQIFDRGICNDGEGREINFTNTVIVMTSNLGLDEIHALCNQPELPDMETIVEAIRPILRDYFKPALLARFAVIPFYPLGRDVLGEIAEMKLKQIASRLRSSLKVAFEYDREIPELLAAKCTQVETGARAIDHVLESDILPRISTEILARMGENQLPRRVRIKASGEGALDLQFESEPA